jgi:hypothetical protein
MAFLIMISGLLFLPESEITLRTNILNIALECHYQEDDRSEEN